MIAPENLRSVWPRVKVGLERVLQVCPDTWLPEDIYCHLRTKLATLYTAHDGDQYRGFFVLEFKRDTFTNESLLNIWCLFGEPTNGEHFADISMFLVDTIEFVESLAKPLGIRLIRMSGRKGWERFLRGVFVPLRVCYERRL
jgi:hypothetical protein